MSAKALFKQIKEHKAKITGPHFLLSAENPKFPEKNEINLDHGQVLSHLKGAGYDAHEVRGHYNAPERSIIVYGIDPDQAEKLHILASRLGQDSSIYSTGQNHEMRFHHGEDAGKKVTGQGTTWHKEKPADYYTSLPGDVHHFTHNFNFEETKKSEELSLVHYSSQPQLKIIDPQFKGTGVDFLNKGRDTWHPHSFFYREGTQPEEVVVNKSKYKYLTTINLNEKKLYDIGEDPNQIISKSVESNNGAFNMELVHEELKKQGFFGFYNSKHPQLKGVVVAYEPTEVKSYERLS